MMNKLELEINLLIQKSALTTLSVEEIGCLRELESNRNHYFVGRRTLEVA
jgi:hypothetical protein